MKAHRLLLLALISSLLTSCGAPLVKRTLGLPANIIKSVTGPILGPLM